MCLFDFIRRRIWGGPESSENRYRKRIYNEAEIDYTKPLQGLQAGINYFKLFFDLWITDTSCIPVSLLNYPQHQASGGDCSGRLHHDSEDTLPGSGLCKQWNEIWWSVQHGLGFRGLGFRAKPYVKAHGWAIGAHRSRVNCSWGTGQASSQLCMHEGVRGRKQ